MLAFVQQLDKKSVPSYNAIRLAIYKKGIKCDVGFCRKIFASWLRQSGIQPEIVDTLQGRVAQSVLTRHYLVPQSSVKD
jgi:intergrase/recombinase